MGKRIPIIFSAIFTMVLTAWTMTARAQFVMTQPNPDESCAVTITFDENGVNFINIGTYLDGTCHLPTWDFMGAPLVVQGSDYNVTADGDLHNCGGVVVESASNVTVSDLHCDAAGGGVMVSGGSNITLSDISIQLAEGSVPRSLDIQGAQGVTASALSFDGTFDQVNIQNSGNVSIAKSSFEVSNTVSFSNVNIAQSNDVSLNSVSVTGGGGGVTLFGATNVSLSQSTITPGADSSTPSILAFESTGLDVRQVTLDRRAAASTSCVNLNGVSDVTISNSKCLSDPAASSDFAIVFTIVSDYLVTQNLIDGSANGIFISHDATGSDNNGEISRNNVNVNGSYGLFLSGASGLDVVRNNFTNSLGTGTGALYYDEAGIPPNEVQLVINFEKNNYSGFALNGECNSLTMICP